VNLNEAKAFVIKEASIFSQDIFIVFVKWLYGKGYKICQRDE